MESVAKLVGIGEAIVEWWNGVVMVSGLGLWMGS